MIDLNTIHNIDCMEYMKSIPDNYFDLCLTDPPYGISISSNPIRQKHKKKNWDNSIPSDEIFKEIFRVSKNQIIWGGVIILIYHHLKVLLFGIKNKVMILA